MERLTVQHAYDPATGFLVAQETVALPPLLTEGPPLDEAVRQAGVLIDRRAGRGLEVSRCLARRTEALDAPAWSKYGHPAKHGVTSPVGRRQARAPMAT